MKEIAMYKDNEQRAYARQLMIKAKNTTGGAEHYEAQIEYHTYRLSCLQIQLDKYKAYDKNEPVYANNGFDDDEFYETVKQTMCGIAQDITSTKKYIGECNAILEYINNNK